MLKSTHPLLGIDGLSMADQVLFNSFGRGSDVNIEIPLVHKAFENTVDVQQDAIAVEHDCSRITYLELEQRANALANRMIRNGLLPKTRVCLVMARSIDMAVAILAVLKSGCQYIPLDGGVVAESALPHIVRDTQSKFILCLERFLPKAEKAALYGGHIIAVDQPNDNSEPQDLSRPNLNVAPSDGAYVIYTSGSTGLPKGVDVAHIGVTNVLIHSPARLGIRRGVKVSHILSVSFDMGQWEILATLLNGGTLVMRTSVWESALAQVDVVIATPSILGRFKPEDFPSIKRVALGGEPCPRNLADNWAQYCEFNNVCGPTEISILNTVHRHQIGDILSIGGPIPNTSLYILDEDLKPLPIGAVGMMWVGGVGVSRGYVNLEKATAEKYKPDIFTNDGKMMYNTGDLGMWRNDGTLIHQGRIDDQVKIKGFRVQLDSISASIESTPEVSKGCAVVINDKLWGFYSSLTPVDPEVVKLVVARAQPYYAVPTSWEWRATLPLTPNGKIDKRSLTASVAGKLASFSVGQIDTALANSHSDSESLSSSDSATTAASSVDSDTYDKGINQTEEDHSDTFDLPLKNGVHGLRSVRLRVFSVYRRFFSLVLLGNIIALVFVLLQPRDQALVNMANATGANLLMAVLMRQDHVVNLIYFVVCSIPTSWPLFIRRHAARVYHIGGLHSGCAMASVAWLIASTILSTIQMVPVVVLVVSYALIVLTVTMVYTAYPSNRLISHDRFEYIHRFFGWLALALFWVQLITTTLSTSLQTFGLDLIKLPAFWFLSIATISIIVPWINLRKVDVDAEVLSNHAVRLHFKHGTATAGTGLRLSERPLLEWHAFATVQKPGEKGFSVLVSKAGDWTTRQIEKPPTKLWVKGVPSAGVLRIAPLFKSIVLVATGSGIGPCLPVIYNVIAGQNIKIRVLWSTPNPEKTFGTGIINSIVEADPKALIHDTKASGRPDIVALTYQMYRESGCEAVCVISNKKVTQMIVYAMETRSIPAFGAIFDS